MFQKIKDTACRTSSFVHHTGGACAGIAEDGLKWTKATLSLLSAIEAHCTGCKMACDKCKFHRAIEEVEEHIKPRN